MRVHNDFYVTTRAFHAGNPSIHWTIGVVPWQKSSSAHQRVTAYQRRRAGVGKTARLPLTQSFGAIFRRPWTLIKYPPCTIRAKKSVWANKSRARLAGVKLIKIYNCNLQVWPLFYSLKTIATLENCTCKSFIYNIDPCAVVDEINFKCQAESRSLYREAWLLTIG